MTATLDDKVNAVDAISVADRIASASRPERAAIRASTLDIIAMARRAVALEALAGDVFAAAYEHSPNSHIAERLAALGYVPELTEEVENDDEH